LFIVLVYGWGRTNREVGQEEGREDGKRTEKAKWLMLFVQSLRIVNAKKPISMSVHWGVRDPEVEMRQTRSDMLSKPGNSLYETGMFAFVNDLDFSFLEMNLMVVDPRSPLMNEFREIVKRLNFNNQQS
jgi:hypothetical protein